MRTTNKAVKRTACTRVREWADTFGEVCLRDLTLMSRYWQVPFINLFLATPHVTFTHDDIIHLLDGRYVGQDRLKQEIAYSFFIHLSLIQQRSFRPDTSSRQLADWTAVPDPEAVLLQHGNLEVNGNIIIQGPTGAGKTSIIRILSELMGFPIVMISCNTLVSSGVVGSSIPDAFMGAYNLYGEEALPYSVVVLTEVDKLREKEEGDAIRNELLSLMDRPGRIEFNTRTGDRGENLSIPTDNMLFIADGVFSGMDAFYKPHLTFSLSADGLVVNESNIRKEHFERWGLPAELLGRITNCVSVQPLTEKDILELLESNSSPIIPIRKMMEAKGGRLIFTDEGKAFLAERTAKSPYGVREIVTLLNQAFKAFLYAGNPLSGTLVINKHSFI